MLPERLIYDETISAPIFKILPQIKKTEADTNRLSVKQSSGKKLQPTLV